MLKYWNLLWTIWGPIELREYETTLRARIVKNYVTNHNLWKNVIDFWCWQGFWSFYINDLIKDSNVVWIDIATEDIKIANKNVTVYNKDSLNFVCYDWIHLPKFKHKFDVLLWISVFLCLNRVWTFEQVFSELDKQIEKWWHILVIELFKNKIFEEYSYKTFIFYEFVDFFRKKIIK